MAKKKSKIKEVVETVESWVGMGPKAGKKKTAKKAAAPKKTEKKTAKKTTKKKSAAPKTAKKTTKKKKK